MCPGKVFRRLSRRVFGQRSQSALADRAVHGLLLLIHNAAHQENDALGIGQINRHMARLAAVGTGQRLRIRQIFERKGLPAQNKHCDDVLSTLILVSQRALR